MITLTLEDILSEIEKGDDQMKKIKIVAIDIETCSIASKYPTYSDFIIGISAHTTCSLDPASNFQKKVFITDELTYEAEEEVIRQFLEFLQDNQGAILTAYNLIGFDYPLLLSRSKEHYPLGFQLVDLLSKFSFYDTLIGYRVHSGRSKSCKLTQALSELRDEGYDCFLTEKKTTFSGRDSLGLWVRQKAGISNDFLSYINEDSYNHMRIAQVLLKLGVNDGLWFIKSHPLVPRLGT